MTLPEEFTARVLRELGQTEGRALCEALDGEPPVSVRLNPAKVFMDGERAGAAGATDAVEAAVAADAVGATVGAGATKTVGATERAEAIAATGSSGAKISPLPGLKLTDSVPWCEEGYYLAARPSFTLDTDFHAGAYYVQEAASQFVGRLLPREEFRGARILDLCAAPGGKTTLYASLAGPEGLVVANEIDRRRAGILADNVRKWGTGNVAVTACDPRLLGEQAGWFDVVAVDAPCSGEGMFRKDPAARGEWSQNNVRMCAARQDAILRDAWWALRPGGTLIYSTCTFNRDEDEGTLERMLAWAGEEVTEAAQVAVGTDWGIVCGAVGPFQTFRFYPHRARGEGFFAAVARKAFDAGGRKRSETGSRRETVRRVRRSPIAPADRGTIAEVSRWIREPERMHFAAVADTLYGWYAAQADAVRELSAVLPVIYSGVALGQLFKGRLKPDPALAFFAGLNRGALPAAELDAEQALRYLRREEIAAAPLTEGLNLVCARGRALGFAKRIGARVNNMYPNSLRILMK
ncbi:methyltransferase RsmF C-terminal domain-like protein [Alistipes sp.]|uniref:methyltransferase RsmF C-terminal domain-like protein n=1 Tax=Alistipes sp. TaxID=1872444 RepID=UPI003AF17B92